MLRNLLAALSLVLISAPVAAEECGWLPTADVDAALPAFAPWSVAGNRFIEYSLAPGREPTKDELKLLIELAKKAPARAS